MLKPALDRQAFRFSVLGSGSSGNSTLVEAGGTSLLIEAGFGARELGRRLELLDRRVSDVACVLLTHEHGDHIRGLSSITRAHKLTVIATEGTLRAVERQLHPQTERRPIAAGHRLDLGGGLEIQAIPLLHDAVDPVGFIVSSGGARLGYATDFGSVDAWLAAAVESVDALIIEANHDVQMLREGPYPWALKRRVLAPTGHLSNADLAAFLRGVELGRCRSLTLAHLSETNNRPETALAAVLDALGGRPIGVRSARQAAPLELEAVAGLAAPVRPRPAVPAAARARPVQLSFPFSSAG